MTTARTKPKSPVATARAAKRIARQARQREALVRSCERWLKSRQGFADGSIVIRATVTITPLEEAEEAPGGAANDRIN
jgi:hypothetical protein